MAPVAFPESNITFAKDQPEYMPLPAYRDEDGQVITCWRLTWRERCQVLLRGQVWLRTLTFCRPIQPQMLEVVSPFLKDGE